VQASRLFDLIGDRRQDGADLGEHADPDRRRQRLGGRCAGLAGGGCLGPACRRKDRRMTLGSHQKTMGDSQSWITPPHILYALGGNASFDLDPAGSNPQPWPCARETWTEGGLERPWHGRIFLNPPFDRYQVGQWVLKLAKHGNGILLIHLRCETEWFAPI
jgi:hypothetical protein